MPSAPRPCIRSPSNCPLPATRLAWQEERDRMPALRFSHLRRLTHSEPHFPHLQNGHTNRMHPQGVPGGLTRDLPTCSQLTQHTSWDFSIWVCPFQLQWTGLLVHQRCSIKVYYVKNTSLGLRHSQLRPVSPPPLNPEHTEATGAELPIQVLAYLALLANS